MAQTCVRPMSDEVITTGGRETSAQRFGWAWVCRTLWLRKRELVAVFALTIGVFAAGLAMPIFTQRAVDTIAKGTATPQLLWLAFGAIAAIAIEAALSGLRQSLVQRLVKFLSRRMSRKAFLHLMRMRIDRGALPAGDILNRFAQVDKIPEFVLGLLPRFLFDAGAGIVALLLMFYYDAVIGATMVIVMVACSLGLRNRLHRVQLLAKNSFEARGRRQAYLSESVTGILTIKALAIEAQRFVRWTVVTDRFIAAAQEVFRQAGRFHIGIRALTQTFSLIVLGLGCYRILHHQLTFGELIALQVLSGRLIAPIISSSDILQKYQDAEVALAALDRFMREPYERATIQPALRRLEGSGIKVTKLTLRYPRMAQPALDDVSFTLPARGRFALVGRNGSGKTSLVRVLLGLQGDFVGNVVIGGQDLRRYDPRSLRAQFGIVDQDTILFSGTIRENIVAGTGSDDDVRVRRALDFAGALGFVEAMPGSLEAVVEEHGHNLSGGQRQRLAIARAIVRDPCLALLDEPAAFLDAEAAVALEKRLAAWGDDRLLVLVTHHLAAARNADAILVLDQGRLVGFGSHATLLDNCGPYAALWNDYSRSMVGGR
jgi:ABC-type bacteriocin/lantibiotic exporter with double-glycine peptidase domain